MYSLMSINTGVMFSNLKSYAKSFVAGAKHACSAPLDSKSKVGLASAGICATIGVVCGPIVAAVIAGSVMVGRGMAAGK